ncbi:MAG: hypothetical protein ACP6IY_12675 [Promethearchaeia archaeon]
MEKKKRIIFVGLGIGLLVISSILIILISMKTSYNAYVNSLEEKEISTIKLNTGDILIIKSDGIKDSVSIIKIYDEKDNLILSSKSELDKGLSLIYTAETSGEYRIVALLDNPSTEVDGKITIYLQHYQLLYLILIGCLFIFSSIVVIASGLLREHYIIPSDVFIDKMKRKKITKEPSAIKKEIKKPEGIPKKEIIAKYKALIQPVDREVIESFILRIYNGIANRTDIIGAYAIDLIGEKIIWRYSDQKGKEELAMLEKPIPLEENQGIKSIFDKMIDLYGGIFPAQIVLSFPNYYLNAMVHKQVMVMVLLKPDVDWGLSSSIFKK